MRRSSSSEASSGHTDLEASEHEADTVISEAAEKTRTQSISSLAGISFSSEIQRVLGLTSVLPTLQERNMLHSWLHQLVSVERPLFHKKNIHRPLKALDIVRNC